MTEHGNPRKVVVIGGGYAGTLASNRLRKRADVLYAVGSTAATPSSVPGAAGFAVPLTEAGSAQRLRARLDEAAGDPAEAERLPARRRSRPAGPERLPAHRRLKTHPPRRGSSPGPGPPSGTVAAASFPLGHDVVSTVRPRERTTRSPCPPVRLGSRGGIRG